MHKVNNNVAGTLALAAQCQAQGLRFIHISSMAAHPGARSRYGREKLAVERALSPEDCIIKPGTIVGNGGLFAKTCALAQALPILPVFYAGSARLQTIYIDDLCTAILHALETRSHGVFALAHAHAVSIKDFYKQIATLLGKKPRLIPLPGNMALAFIIVIEKLGLRLPITSDNLLGLKYGKVFETHNSCRELGIDPLSLDDTIQKLMHPPGI
jgi:nucleoside-diphosphate-sugar epimerase